MRYELKIILASMLAAFMAMQAFGDTPADSVKVYFRVGSSQFDPAFDDNRRAMESFIDFVKTKYQADEIDSILVRGFASPEGASVSNEELSLLRCKNVAEIIIKEAKINPANIRLNPEGVAWKELRRIVADTPEAPSKEKILDIIDNVPLWIRDSKGAIVDGRKKRLMELDRGDTFRWLQLNVFPMLRNAVAIALYVSPKEPDLSSLPSFSDISKASEYSDTSDNSDKSDCSDIHDCSDISVCSEDVYLSESSDTLSMPLAKNEPTHFNMAVKTNMLYDAFLVPNLGVEFCIGRNISVYGEWMYAWWDNDRRHRYWRVYGGDIGLRWWFGGKAHSKSLTGHHIGIYGGILTFDFEAGGTGYLGGKPGGTLWDRWLVNSGIEYGYSFSVGKRLNIGLSIGFGYMGGNYIKYYPFDNDYYFEKEYNMRYFGPTKAEISLVWIIGAVNHFNRKGGEE